MIKVPPYLKRGDTIGIVAPAGYMAFEKMQTCIETLNDWGYHVKLGDTTFSHSTTYFSGTDVQRLNDFQQMLDDPQVKAILCARGGYGISRIIDDLNFKKFRKTPKWIIGFSDVTILHYHLQANLKTASLHAPMAAAFNDNGFNNNYIDSLRAALGGEKANYECESHPFNKQGEARGRLIGGNLTLIAHLIGTESDVKTKNRILFIEDIGEQLYNIDRMLLQLKRSGKLSRLAGLIVGGFSDCKDTERPFGKTAYEIIQEHVKEYKYPVCYGFPVSHEKENYALKTGVVHTLSITNSNTILRER